MRSRAGSGDGGAVFAARESGCGCGDAPYISTGLRDHKFGVDIGEAAQCIDRARAFRHLRAAGVVAISARRFWIFRRSWKPRARC